MATWARPEPTSRWVGHVAGVVAAAVLAYLVNVQPGWRAVGFLTEDTAQVVPLVNASLVLGVAVHLVQLVHDGARVRAAGDLVTGAVSVVVLLQLWTVFPFDVDGTPMPVDLPWGLLVRTVLAFALATSVVVAVAALVRLARSSRHASDPAPDRHAAPTASSPDRG